MEYELFSKTVIQHRNSMILIGILVLVFVIVGTLIVEFYVRRELDCPYFKIKNIRFSPTLLMALPIIFTLIYFPIEIYKCNYDIQYSSYEEYIGEVEYSSSSVKLKNCNLSVFVGKGHEIIPLGKHYGKVIYSTKANVIVYYESLEDFE